MLYQGIHQDQTAPSVAMLSTSGMGPFSVMASSFLEPKSWTILLKLLMFDWWSFELL